MLSDVTPDATGQTRPPPRRGGFSLIELVIVVVIIGIIAAIAIPRFSRASAGGGDAAYAASLRALRAAIDRYYVEHDAYPTAAPLTGNRTTIMLQLTRYTDRAGNTSKTPSATHAFGPYLRSIPVLPVGANRGASKIDVADGPAIGWAYNPATGEITGNTGAATDAAGRPYVSY